MKTEDQLCKYEQSVKLFKAGINVKSLNFWCDIGNGPELCDETFKGVTDKAICPAYTVAELLEILPFKLLNTGEDDNYLELRKSGKGYSVSYNKLHCQTPFYETAAEALASAIIALIIHGRRAC